MVKKIRLTLTDGKRWYNNENGETTFCADFIETRLGRKPGQLTLSGSTSARKGFKRVRIRQHASTWDNHYIEYDRSADGFPGCLFKPLCLAIAGLLKLPACTDQTRFLWYKITG